MSRPLRHRSLRRRDRRPDRRLRADRGPASARYRSGPPDGLSCARPHRPRGRCAERGRSLSSGAIAEHAGGPSTCSCRRRGRSGSRPFVIVRGVRAGPGDVGPGDERPGAQAVGAPDGQPQVGVVAWEWAGRARPRRGSSAGTSSIVRRVWRREPRPRGPGQPTDQRAVASARSRVCRTLLFDHDPAPGPGRRCRRPRTGRLRMSRILEAIGSADHVGTERLTIRPAVRRRIRSSRR
jgi:hypothetical protein